MVGGRRGEHRMGVGHGVVVGAGSYGKRCATVQIVDAIRHGVGTGLMGLLKSSYFHQKRLSEQTLRRLARSQITRKSGPGIVRKC